jgi:hypothetical protein
MKKVMFAFVLLLSMAVICPTHTDARGGGHGGGHGGHGGGFHSGGFRGGYGGRIAPFRAGGIVGYQGGSYYGPGYSVVPSGYYGSGCYQDCVPVYDQYGYPLLDAEGNGVYDCVCR